MTIHQSRTFRSLAAGVALTLGAGGAVQADEVVYATTGGQMRVQLEEHFYTPFAEQTEHEIIPFDIEVPDQWARAEAMTRSGNVEFDIVTATGPDLVDKADILMEIPCDEMKNVQEYGLPGSCERYGIPRTTGGMLIAYDSNLFPEDPPATWADFWNVEKYPGPRGLPDTGDRDWWVPAVALLADGVAPEDLFPFDLDRAYAKLDEIRPHVAVWWKTGSQVQQIMRDKEVVMTMAYSGRALTVVKEGDSFRMAWDGALRDTGYFAVMKDAPRPEAALAFIDFFYGAADGHPAFISAVNYATSSTAGLAKLPEDEQKLYATYPANYAKLVKPDFKWIGENRDVLRERWMAWITDGRFRPERLRTLRTRLSAAYKGIHALLMAEGARDLRSGQHFKDTVFFDEYVDIHHIFPQDWCKKQKIEPKVFDTVVNKTPLSYKTNRILGGVAPSIYLERLETGGKDNPPISREALDDYLASHGLDPSLLRADDFEGFMADRETRLLAMISKATGHSIVRADSVPEEGEDVLQDDEGFDVPSPDAEEAA
ncbi:extracellular solute-binding protein [Pukyongiella litopenaei]|uniref:Extracellular solute-binding protein n=1 Tax=Pukyongiella litopenaei TaxID=2605946 RepID=A0A2S0MQP0_9RHOB|nr:extracellular solute-binding protein [Pukyongiella litopenaei]AVO38210.1 extracellular solute-binding protein [Pukyongiella litopenaei]